jgi:DNA-binding response OmpR family regulator
MPPDTIRILVVEDDSALLRQITKILSAQKYAVCEATSYNEALRCIENESFDLAILDIVLDAAGNGIEILKYLREHRGYGLPVIMQTSMADDLYCVHCLNLGADSVCQLTHDGALLGRQLAHHFQNGGQFAFFAKPFYTLFIQSGGVIRSFQSGQRILLDQL